MPKNIILLLSLLISTQAFADLKPSSITEVPAVKAVFSKMREVAKSGHDFILDFYATQSFARNENPYNCGVVTEKKLSERFGDILMALEYANELPGEKAELQAAFDSNIPVGKYHYCENREWGYYAEIVDEYFNGLDSDFKLKLHTVYED